MVKVFLVEDEAIIRHGIRDNIDWASHGFEFAGEAGDGEYAYPLILKAQPDILVTDIKMPFMDGLSVIEAARAQGIKAEFVIVSAYADFDFAKQSISLGVIEYLLKPLTRDEAEAVLKKIENKISGKNSYSRRKSRNLRDKYPDAHPMILQALDIIQSGYAGKISQKKLLISC